MQSEKINCLFLKDTHLAGRFPKSILYFIWRIFCHSLKFWFSQKTTIICLFVVLLIQYEKKNMKSCLLSDDKLWKHKIFFAIKVNNTVSKWGFFVQRKWEEEKYFAIESPYFYIQWTAQVPVLFRDSIFTLKHIFLRWVIKS